MGLGSSTGKCTCNQNISVTVCAVLLINFLIFTNNTKLYYLAKAEKQFIVQKFVVYKQRSSSSEILQY